MFKKNTKVSQKVKGRKLWEKLSSPSVSGGKLYMGKICDEQMLLPSLSLQY